MIRLALHTLRYRLASFLGTFTAIFAGAAIIMACGGLMETGIRLSAPPERINTPIVISRDYATSESARLTQSTMQKVAAVAGVERVVLDISFAADTPESSVKPGLFGHPWSTAALTPYAIRDGQEPNRSNEVVMDIITTQAMGKSVGETVDIVVRGEKLSFILSGVAQALSEYSFPAFFFSDGFVATTLKDQQPDALGVVAASGIDTKQLQHNLEVALEPEKVRVLAGDDRGLAEYAGMSGAQEVLIAGSAPFGGNTIVVVGFVVAAILGLSIRQRTREMALLQTVGATPGQVRRMVVIEVMIIAIAATALAVIPGYWLGEFMLNALKSNGLVPQQVLFYQGLIPTTIGVAVGLIASLVASLIAARHATNVQPIDALADVSKQKRWFNWGKLVLAIIGLLGGLALALVTALVMRGAVASSTAGPAVLPWLLAFGMMAPALIIPGVALLSAPLRAVFTHATGYLAAKNMRVRYLHAASIVTPIMLASAMALSMLYQQTTLTAMTEKALTQDVHADAVVRAGKGTSLEEARSINTVTGVDASSPIITSEAYFIDKDGQASEDPFRIQGISPDSGKGIFRYKVTDGSLAKLKGKTLALSESQADSLNRKIGDTVMMRFGDGRDETLTLVALYESPKGFESGLVPADTLITYTASGLVSLIAVQTKTLVTPQTLQEAVAANTNIHNPEVASGDALLQGIRNQTSVLSWVNMLFTAMVSIYALLFLINTVVITVVARRREFGLQQLIGSTRGEVLRMLGLEALTLSIIGVVAGMIVSSVSLIPFSMAINGTPFPRGSWLILVAVVVLAILLNVIVTLLTGRYALRVAPIKAAANRE